MSWMGAVPGIGSIVGGIGGSYYANKMHKRAMRERAQVRDQMLGMINEGVGHGKDFADYGRGQYEDWMGRIDPLWDELSSEAMKKQSVDYGKIAGDTRDAVANAREQAQRQMQRYGVNPGDGQWQASERQYGIGGALSEVAARDQARRALRNERYEKLNNVFGMGQKTALTGANMMSQGYGLVGDSYRTGISGMAGLLQDSSNQASQAGQNFSDSVSGIYEGVNKLWGVGGHWGPEAPLSYADQYFRSQLGEGG